MKVSKSRSGSVSRRKQFAAGQKHILALESGEVSEQVLMELKRRVLEIEAGYREVAQQMGQLYMYADQEGLAFLTRYLDRTMSTASENERAMVSILDELQLHANRHPTRGN